MNHPIYARFGRWLKNIIIEKWYGPFVIIGFAIFVLAGMFGPFVMSCESSAKRYQQETAK